MKVSGQPYTQIYVAFHSLQRNHNIPKHIPWLVWHHGKAHFDQKIFSFFHQNQLPMDIWSDIERFSFYDLFVLNFSKAENFRQIMLIIIIKYSFMCYFSKPEHIAHYKAKNKTAVKANFQVNKISWRGKISKMISKMWVCLMISFCKWDFK